MPVLLSGLPDRAGNKIGRPGRVGPLRQGKRAFALSYYLGTFQGKAKDTRYLGSTRFLENHSTVPPKRTWHTYLKASIRPVTTTQVADSGFCKKRRAGVGLGEMLTPRIRPYARCHQLRRASGRHRRSIEERSVCNDISNIGVVDSSNIGPF
eukprot:COSAG02_NODE_1438_length_12604_cov_27.849580_11_plen_152_part_00